jgi:hypothetical protein
MAARSPLGGNTSVLKDSMFDRSNDSIFDKWYGE